MATETIFQTISILSITLMTIEIIVVHSQECKNIVHTIAIHEDARTNHVLECDIEFHHEIRIFKVEYRIMKKAPYRPRDNEDLNESCLIKGLTAEIKEKCHRTQGCLFLKEDFDKYEEESAARFPYKCDSYIGARYLLVEFQCRAELNRDFNAYAIDLNDNRTHEVTFAVIDSHNLWRWTLNYCHPYLNHDCSIPEESIRNSVLITGSSKGCSCKIPANTEMWVLAHEFYKFPPENQPDYRIGECSQRIQVYNSEQRWELCKQKDFFRLPCQETEQTLYLSFENDDINIRVGFAIYFEVDYLASPMMMCTCDIPVNELPARPRVEPSSVTTTTTTTTVGPLRTTIPTTTTTGAPLPAKEDSFDFFKDTPSWIVILLAVVVSIIIMLIVISIVCLRHCRKKTGYLEDNQSLDAYGTVSSLSTSESWATENPFEEPPTPKPPSLIASGKSKTTGPKTVHFSDTREDEDGDYMVGGDAKYSSLKSEGFDFF